MTGADGARYATPSNILMTGWTGTPRLVTPVRAREDTFRTVDAAAASSCEPELVEAADQIEGRPRERWAQPAAWTSPK
jgi:hypothetical protein